MAGNPGATTMGNTGFDVGFCERKRLAGHADECQQIGIERTNADDAFGSVMTDAVEKAALSTSLVFLRTQP
jgi:hypothetical protein